MLGPDFRATRFSPGMVVTFHDGSSRDLLSVDFETGMLEIDWPGISGGVFNCHYSWVKGIVRKGEEAPE
jgi:hypothetical protein